MYLGGGGGDGPTAESYQNFGIFIKKVKSLVKNN